MTRAIRFGLLIALVLTWIEVYVMHGHDSDFSTRLSYVSIPICVAIVATLIVDMYRRNHRDD